MTDKNQWSEFNHDEAMERLKKIGERLKAINEALKGMRDNDPADWWKNPSD